jgi:hypothetical protein
MKLSFKRITGIGVAVVAIAGLIVGVATWREIGNANRITNIELMNGQTVYAVPGAEMIVRTGKTFAVSTDKEGIPDVTAGQDLLPGTPISDNHLLFFPKNTRGLTADPNTDNEIWITVRGGYTVYDASGKKITPISE